MIIICASALCIAACFCIAVFGWQDQSEKLDALERENRKYSGLYKEVERLQKQNAELALKASRTEYR